MVPPAADRNAAGSAATVLVDCGNSRSKWCRYGRRGIEACCPPETVEGLLAAWDPAELVLLAGAAAPAAALRRLAAGRRLREVGDDPPLPDCGQYPACGADRVLAGLAAVRDHGPAVVVDCGTATTLGAWRVLDGGPRFAGGMILPGLAACLDGLAAAAPALPRVAPPPAPPPVAACATAEAIAAGAAGYPAWVAAARDRLVAATGIATTLVTGGDAERCLPALPGATPVVDLVLRGMYLLVEEHDHGR